MIVRIRTMARVHQKKGAFHAEVGRARRPGPTGDFQKVGCARRGAPINPPDGGPRAFMKWDALEESRSGLTVGRLRR